MSVVLSLCDLTCNAVIPWAEAGYDCYCVDIEHPRGWRGHPRYPNITLIGQDVRTFSQFSLPDMPYIVLAAPPCTDMAVSGARWFAWKGLSRIIDALQLVERCRAICEDYPPQSWGLGHDEQAGLQRVFAPQRAPKYMLENPISTLSSYWRKPNYIFNPNQYGGYLEDPSTDAYLKKTCLWTGGGFVMPEKRIVPVLHGSKMHLMPPSDDRAALRSETPMGFSRAVFMANDPAAALRSIAI